MPRAHHPIFDPAERELTDGGFAREEVRLANRNPGTLLETLRYDLTPLGLHYLLIHFDLPYAPSAADWGTLTDTNGVGAFFIASVPARFDLKPAVA